MTLNKCYKEKKLNPESKRITLRKHHLGKNLEFSKKRMKYDLFWRMRAFEDEKYPPEAMIEK